MYGSWGSREQRPPPPLGASIIPMPKISNDQETGAIRDKSQHECPGGEQPKIKIGNITKKTVRKILAQMWQLSYLTKHMGANINIQQLNHKRITEDKRAETDIVQTFD